ncbi:MAG: metallophosphoesterase family protein [Treponema sp.]|jgi:hypothetical protein|nr:metallophosphoesterase family protein [Treponema sp.]
MMKKKMKWSALQLIVLVLGVAFVIAAQACEGDEPEGTVPEAPPVNYTQELNWGVSSQASVATLGLMPGDNTTEINLNWYSSGAPANKVAQVRFIKGTLAAGTKLLEGTGTVGEAGSTGNTSHKVTVKGLESGSSYQYAVSSDGTNWSDAYNFKVPAATGAWKFAVIADPQLTKGNVDANSRYPAVGTTTAAGWVETMQKITAANVSFIASCGDQVDAGAGDEVEYTNYFAPAGLRNLPVAPTSGNHDNHMNFSYHYNLPNQQIFTGSLAETTETATGRNYYYLYNNILFVVLDTAPYPGNTDAARPYIERFNATLTAAKAANTGKYDWLIVQHHKSTASVGDHAADRDIQYYVEAGFERVMSEQNVDFVLAGHDHVYARSYPLQGLDGGKVSLPDKSKSGQDNKGPKTVTATPGKPIYLTFTTGSGLKYYAVSADKTFNYNNTLYVKDNTAYPYMGTTGTDGSADGSKVGSVFYMAGNLPVSNAAYVQPYIPSYATVDVNGKSITFKTYAIKTASATSPGATEPYSFDENTPYDQITVTK